MQILWFISTGLLLIYIIRILYYRSGWKSVIKGMQEPGENQMVSVVIPVRNEKDHIGLLINDLLDQDYPSGKYEIIIVDDHSSDGTGKVVESIQGSQQKDHPEIRLLSLETAERGKKAALRKGILAADHPLILNTDGDCRADSAWVKEMAGGFSDPMCRMMIAGVIFDPDRSMPHAMQSLEFFSHIAISAGSSGLKDPILCSAANMAYFKEDYLGFIHDQEKVSESGDDIFLLLWLKKKYPGSVQFNASQNAVIRTHPAQGLASFLWQRMRWTSKSRHYRDLHIISTAIIIFGLNLILTVLLLASLIFPLLYGNLNPGLWILFASSWMLKSLSDLYLLLPVLRHYRKTPLLWYFVPLELIYFIYVSFIGLLGQFLSISWKGRKINAKRS